MRVNVIKILYFFFWCPGSEPRTLHILCIVLTNWAKLTRTINIYGVPAWANDVIISGFKYIKFFLLCFFWFCRLSVALCCSSSCAAFDFMSCCGVRLVHIERSTSVNHKFNQWFERQRCRSIMYFYDLDFIILSVCLLAVVCWVCSRIQSLHFIHVYI